MHDFSIEPSMMCFSQRTTIIESQKISCGNYDWHHIGCGDTPPLSSLGVRMVRLSSRLSSIGTGFAKYFQKPPEDVIRLTIGEPDLDTPEAISDAAIAALRDGQTHYSRSLGLERTTQAVSTHIVSESGPPRAASTTAFISTNVIRCDAASIPTRVSIPLSPANPVYLSLGPERQLDSPQLHRRSARFLPIPATQQLAPPLLLCSLQAVFTANRPFLAKGFGGISEHFQPVLPSHGVMRC